MKKFIRSGFIKKLNKNFWLSVGLGVILAWFFFILISGIADLRSGEATLILVFGNQERMFQGEVVDNMTVLDVLRAATKAGQINLEFVVDADRTSITKLDGHLVGSEERFKFLLNGFLIEESDIHNKTVKAGDIVEIKLD